MLKIRGISFLSLIVMMWSGFFAHSSTVASEHSESSELRVLIIGEVFANSEIWDNLSELCNRIGGRVSGTVQGDQAQELVTRKFTEFGLLGSKAYVTQHQQELDRIIMMMNLDMVGTPYGYRVHGHEETIPFLTSLAQSMTALGMDPEKVSSRVGIYGDYEPFLIQGVPTMTIRSKLEDEMGRYYHTAGDTFDKLNFKSLSECAAVVAVTLMEMANTEEVIGTRMPPERVKDILIENNLKEPLKYQGNWPFDETHE